MSKEVKVTLIMEGLDISNAESSVQKALFQGFNLMTDPNEVPKWFRVAKVEESTK